MSLNQRQQNILKMLCAYLTITMLWPPFYIGIAGGAVINYAVGPMKGKCSGEQALLREISGSLCKNDLLLADALHSTWWAVQMLVQRGVDLVMPNDGRRRVDFSEGRIHSESDHVV